MLCCKLGQEKGHSLDSAKFQTAFNFLKRGDLETLPDGWIELEHGVRASIQRYTTRPAQELRFETHDKYMDLQYLGRGLEKIGVVCREGLTEETAYDAGDDVTFHRDPAQSGEVLLTAGDYVILTPEDAHKPRCAAGEEMPVFKVVIKIPAL